MCPLRNWKSIQQIAAGAAAFFAGTLFLNTLGRAAVDTAAGVSPGRFSLNSPQPIGDDSTETSVDALDLDLNVPSAVPESPVRFDGGSNGGEFPLQSRTLSIGPYEAFESAASDPETAGIITVINATMSAAAEALQEESEYRARRAVAMFGADWYRRLANERPEPLALNQSASHFSVTQAENALPTANAIARFLAIHPSTSDGYSIVNALPSAVVPTPMSLGSLPTTATQDAQPLVSAARLDNLKNVGVTMSPILDVPLLSLPSGQPSSTRPLTAFPTFTLNDVIVAASEAMGMSLPVSPVPEPSMLGLASLTGFGLLARRRTYVR